MAQLASFCSLKESVLERIRRDIVTQVLLPGEIVRDNELAARYEVSTSPIREALVHLATERLVEMPPNRPKRVSAMDRKIARDFFAVYKLVALAGFAWGAPKAGSRELAIMADISSTISKMSESADRYELAQHARGFYEAVYEASGNSELIYTIKRRLGWIDRILFLVRALENKAVLAEWQNIIDSLRDGDFTTAIVIHRRHLELVEREIESIEFTLT